MFTNSLDASQEASRLYYEGEVPKVVQGAPNGTHIRRTGAVQGAPNGTHICRTGGVIPRFRMETCV